MKFKPTDQFTLSTDVLSQEVNGETVLLNLAGENYFGLNQVGTSVWQLLQAEHSVASVVDSLYADYDISRAQLESDVDSLLAELLKDDLIKLAD